MSYNTFYPQSIDPFDILFQNMLRGTGFKTIRSSMDYPCDIYFDDDCLIIDLPIVDANVDDIKVTNAGDKIRVVYHRPEKNNVSDFTYLNRSIVRRDFDLMWQISPKFDLSKLQANYRNGLFSIRVPWSEESLPKEVPVLDLSNQSNKIASGAKKLREEAVN